MQCGDRSRITDIGWDCFDVFSGKVLELVSIVQKPFSAFLENNSVLCFHHSVNKGIDLFSLNSCKIISYGNIKLEPILCTQTEFFCNHMKDKPCLDVFAHRVRNSQLSRPFAVIALIICKNTRFIHTCRKLCTIHLLNRLQFKETGSCIIRSDDILCKLGVGTGCRSHWCLQVSGKNSHIILRICCIWAMYPKYSVLPFFLLKDPVHQLPERHTCHNIAHIYFPPLISSASSCAD